MSLTEEQRGTVGFDMEKNRAAIDSAINSLLCEGWDNEASTVRRLVAEIERLRATIEGYEIDIASFLSDRQVSSEIIRELRAKKDENALIEAIEEQAARIQELEGMLSIRTEELEIAHSCTRSEREMHEKELAVFARKINDLEDALVEKQTALMPSAPRCYADARRQAAIEQLQAEGKIGPDAKPRSWQITEERKAALSAMSSLRTDVDCPQCDAWLHFSDIAKHAPVLRAMLTEAGKE